MKNIFMSTIMNFITMSAAFGQTFTCGDTLIDTRDGQKYPTVQIGAACWMKKNLNYGTAVPSYTSTTFHSDMANNSVVEKYAYNNDNTKLLTYGGLYEWDELMNYTTAQVGQGICPNGWHVPTDAEWQTMIAAAGGTLITPNGGYGGNKLKNIGEGFGAGAGTNTSGFSAKHGGDRDSYGIFYGLNLRSIFWTSTPNGPGAYQYTLWAENDTIFRGGNAQKMTGFACRCVKDATTGFNENFNEGGINIFPNPTNSVINFQVNEFSGQLIIFNSFGQQLKTIEGVKHGSSIQLETFEWPSGIYFIRLINKEGQNRIVQKFVVE